MRPPIKTTQAALNLLQQHRQKLIQKGYTSAVELVKRYGVITSLDVLRYMRDQGRMTARDEALNARWLAVVFTGKLYKSTWRRVGMRRQGDRSRNIHAAPRTLWALASNKTKAKNPKDLHIEALEAANERLRARIAELEDEVPI